MKNVYLRVGPTSPGHGNFIRYMAKACNLQLFCKKGLTPKKICHGPGSSRFNNKALNCKFPKMLAFDNCHAKEMCSVAPIEYNFHWNGFVNNFKTVVFSINDTGMKSCAEIDADDLLRHAFPNECDEKKTMLYSKILEIHHMLPDGTVRILACGGKKLEDPIVVTETECLERILVGAA